MVKYHFQCGADDIDPAAKEAQTQLTDEIRDVVRAARADHDGSEGLMKDAFSDGRFDLFLRQGMGNYEMGTKSFERVTRVLDEVLAGYKNPEDAPDVVEFNKMLCACLIASGNKAHAEIIQDSGALLNEDGQERDSLFNPLLKQHLTGDAVSADVSNMQSKAESALERMQREMDQLTV